MSEKAIQPVASAEFPTRWGKFRIYGFRESGSDGNGRTEEAVALVMGDVHSTPPLVR
ncbi:MAG: GTP cyclohydrolase II, partial [Candidatus Sulfotelmatobacter sp.]